MREQDEIVKEGMLENEHTPDDQEPDVVDNGFTGLSLLRLAQLAMDQFLFEPIDTNPRRHWTLARDASEALALARPLLERAIATLAEGK